MALEKRNHLFSPNQFDVEKVVVFVFDLAHATIIAKCYTPMIVAIEQLNPKAELLANPVINLGGFDHRKVPYIPAALPT